MGSAPTLAWLQLALDEQDAVEVKTQVNVAAGRVDVLVGRGLRAAVQPDDEAGAVALHGALAFNPVATETQKQDLLERVDGAGLDADLAVVNAEWLAFRRIVPAERVGTPADLGEALRSFLVDSLDALKDADSEGIL